MKAINPPNPNHKWFILILGCLTNALVAAMPGMALSVLLPSIANELNLNVVQAGLAWGIGALPGIFAFLLAGMAIDRFGPRRVLIVAGILTSLLGAARGLSTNYGTLLFTIVLSGFFTPFIPMSSVKNTRIWFNSNQIGLANGVLSLGMAAGFFTGAMISANFVAPWLGGWRNTFYFYGLIGVLIVLPWLLTHSAPSLKTSPEISKTQAVAGSRIRNIILIKNIWLLGLTLFCFGGGIQGFLGYLPLYLRDLGWATIEADGLAASFHLASLFFTIPLTLLSDRLKSRKGIAIGAVTLTSLGILLFAILRGDALWGAVIAAGLTRDGVMAILITMALETKGVKNDDTGVTTGFILIFAGIGSLIAPPLGNLLVALSRNAPFLFWGGLSSAGALCLAFLNNSQLGRIKRPSAVKQRFEDAAQTSNLNQ